MSCAYKVHSTNMASAFRSFARWWRQSKHRWGTRRLDIGRKGVIIGKRGGGVLACLGRSVISRSHPVDLVLGRAVDDTSGTA